jgi:hypothetical protein
MDEKEKKPVLSKADFLEVFATSMKSAGVVFTVDGKNKKSTNFYWELLRLSIYVIISIIAAAGSDVSLAGIFSGRFSEVGRDPTRRYKKPKINFSSKILTMFKENPALVYDTPYTDAQELNDRVVSIMQNFGGIKNIAGTSAGTEPPAEILEV